MSVEINIDLNSKAAHGKIETLRAELKTLNDSVDLDIEGDLGKKIQELTDGLDEINIDVDYSDLQKAVALKSALQGDIEVDLDTDNQKLFEGIQDNLDPPDDGGIDHGSQARKFKNYGAEDARFSRFMDTFKQFKEPRKIDGDFQSRSARRDFIDRQQKEIPRLKRFQGMVEKFQTPMRRPNGNFAPGDIRDNFLRDVRKELGVDKPTFRGMPDNPLGRDSSDYSDYATRMKGLGQKHKDMGFDVGFDKTKSFSRGDDGGSMLPSLPGLFGGKNKSNLIAEKAGEGFTGLRKKMKAAIPSMSMFYNLLAAVIPILAVVATQLIGVAAAMGAVAVAGASMIGLGLLGHGEDMASSWKKAKEQLSTLKDEMFDVFQPTMQTFAPIQAKFFDVLPEELNKVATAMESLTVYSDTLFQALSGLTDWIADGFRGMAKYEETISQLALRFGELIGSSIGDFFQFVIKEAANGQDTLVQLGAMVVDLAKGFYFLAKVITNAVTGFRWVASTVAWLGELLDNKVVVAIVTFAATLAITTYTITALTGAITVLVSIMNAGLIATLISSWKRLAGYIFRTIAATAANYGLAASIANVVAFATLGIGALLGMAAAAQAVDGMKANVGVDKSGLPGSGGMGGGYGAGAGGGASQTIINEGDTNVTVNGEMSNADREGLADITNKESNISKARKFPGE